MGFYDPAFRYGGRADYSRGTEIEPGVDCPHGSTTHFAIPAQVAKTFSLIPWRTPKEVEALVRGGMTPLQALQAATMNGAALLNWSDSIGTIEPGKFADIIAIGGDPIQNINAIEKVVFVMKDGMTFKNDLAPKPALGMEKK